mgnify:CR=1 FL=1
MSKSKVCIVTKYMYSIYTFIECMKMSQEYLISSIVLFSDQIKTIHEYCSIKVFPSCEMEKCIAECDTVFISETIYKCDDVIQRRIIQCANKNSKTICNNTISNKIQELDIDEQTYAYKPIEIPVFIITTMRQNIGEQKLLLELIKHINSLGENVLGISSGYSGIFFNNVYPFPINSFHNIEKGEERILYLNTYFQKTILKTNSTIMIILVNGNFCNPYLLPDFETSYNLNLIESACKVDYHINIVPLNFISSHSLVNNNLRVNYFSKKQVDINVISNVLFDVPNEDVYQTGQDIPTVTVMPKNANHIISSLKNSSKILFGSLCDNDLLQIIIDDIINKLKRKTLDYKIL